MLPRGVSAVALMMFGVAMAQDSTKTWDFQADKVDESPAGFSAGKVGVWTKADSVTYFDALSVKPL